MMEPASLLLVSDVLRRRRSAPDFPGGPNNAIGGFQGGTHMPDTRTPYADGRQPCGAFKENRMNKPRTCPMCTTMVQWCGNCSQNHHSGGWQTCPGKQK